tara:strand:+ start:6531 stop:6803 length:273 start_codon:yes stop_codon:yes gene_type:complete
MYIIVIDGEDERGAYSVTDEDGENVLYIWENGDDAERFVMMLEESGSPKMKAVEVEDEPLIDACFEHEYLYAIIGPNDLVIPPEEYDDNF